MFWLQPIILRVSPGVFRILWVHCWNWFSKNSAFLETDSSIFLKIVHSAEESLSQSHKFIFSYPQAKSPQTKQRKPLELHLDIVNKKLPFYEKFLHRMAEQSTPFLELVRTETSKNITSELK